MKNFHKGAAAAVKMESKIQTNKFQTHFGPFPTFLSKYFMFSGPKFSCTAFQDVKLKIFFKIRMITQYIT